MQQKDIREELQRRVLVLDGAMGTMIQQHHLTENDFKGSRFKNHPVELQGNNDILCLTQPMIIESIHQKYLEAGADIITTNSFNANRISLADYKMESMAYQINKAASIIAKKAVGECNQRNSDRPRYVVGTMGPTNKTLSLSPDVNDPGFRAVSFDQMVDVYQEQAQGLIDGGADLLMVETIFDTLNAKAALMAIEYAFGTTKKKLPVMVSVTISDASGRTLSGQTLQAFIISISHHDLLSIGINCSLGAKELRPYVKELSDKSLFYLSVHPNAGLPNQFGGYDEQPRDMAEFIEDFLKNRWVNIVGGCCGTTPAHIRYFAGLCRNYKPRVLPAGDHLTKLSGLEPLVITKEMNFVNIGERANVAGSRKFARLISEEKFDEALSIARQQVETGAQIIDVNMDDAMIDGPKAMSRFLHLVAVEPDIAKVPIMIDSSKWSIIETGLKCLQGKCIVNSISLKEGEQAFKECAHKIKLYGAATVVMAFDEKGQASSLERRIEICSRVYNILTKELNFPAEDIIFDPNILSVATGMEEHNNYANDFIESIKWIKENLPYAKISGGVSNLSFSFRGNDNVRDAMHSVFLYYAIKAGMDMGIVNPSMLQVYDQIPKDLLERVEDVILNRRPDATERLIDFANNMKNDNKAEVVIDQWRNEPLQQRLNHAMIKGITEYLEEDLEQARLIYPSSLDIIETVLMEGMGIVGELFGNGKMFLPQVVKSARVMKKAVAYLMPYIEAEKATRGEQKNAGKIVLATVKGDVHDIGKNIVSVVLACNNYQVIDLGVMVPAEKILQTAINENADVIGLSGLITPSLEEMVHVASEMQRMKLSIPLLIGGATTSKIHTAVKISPNYSHPVIHVKDASLSVPIISNLLSKTAKASYINALNKDYESVRLTYGYTKNKVPHVDLATARKNKALLDFSSSIVKPRFLGIQTFSDYPIEEIRKYINWIFFFFTWGLKGKFPNILQDRLKGEEATKLYNDANKMLDRIVDEKLIHANATIGLFAANAVGDDIEVYADETRTNVIATFYNLRNQTISETAEPNYCLSDFIAPKDNGVCDYFGAFAVTAGIGMDKVSKMFEKNNDDYSNIMLKVLGDRLAEAFTELIHLKVRTELWGYQPKENLSVEDLLAEKFIGIRPAHGYPACPDHTEKATLFKLINAQKNIDVTLTESFMMNPASSVSGLLISHPQSRYFHIDKIDKTQVEDYAKRKGISIKETEKWLASNLNY